MNAAAKDQKAVNEMVAAPHEKWILIVRRRLRANDTVYDVGCSIEPAALGKNYQALLDARFVMWQPGQVGNAKPRAAPPTSPPQAPNPPIVIVPDLDPVSSWKKSVAAMTKLMGGDQSRARSWMLTDDKASRLYQRAARISALRGAPFRRVVAKDL